MVLGLAKKGGPKAVGGVSMLSKTTSGTLPDDHEILYKQVGVHFHDEFR